MEISYDKHKIETKIFKIDNSITETIERSSVERITNLNEQLSLYEKY